MILTGSEIRRQVALGNITLKPFAAGQINPNSYNYRLGSVLKVPRGLDSGRTTFETVRIPEEGFELPRLQMCLGHTAEVIGSSRFAMSLIGRSSMGRLGLFLQVSANLGHTTSCHRWTLELVAAKPIRIYPGMRIGQVSFWTNDGTPESYDGVYGRWNLPAESRLLSNR